jgi:hypothetical protein
VACARCSASANASSCSLQGEGHVSQGCELGLWAGAPGRNAAAVWQPGEPGGGRRSCGPARRCSARLRPARRPPVALLGPELRHGHHEEPLERAVQRRALQLSRVAGRVHQQRVGPAPPDLPDVRAPARARVWRG